MLKPWGARVAVVLTAALALLVGCGSRPREVEAGREAGVRPWSEPPPSPVSRYDGAKRLYEQGRYAQAADAFAKWAHDYPKNPLEPAALYYLARSQFGAGRKPEARATYERLEKAHPKTDWAGFARQDMAALATTGPARLDRRPRRRWWHPVDWLTPDPPPVRDFEAARQHYRARRFDKAVVAFRALAERNPKSPLAPASWYYAGRCYEKVGELDKARETFQHVATTYAKTEWEWLAQEDLRRLKPE
jgi:soluble lytic murein transglycosylase